jgi:cytochrome c
MQLTSRLSLTLLAIVLVAGPAHAQLRGHGGPVRAIAIASDGQRAISGSFDTSAIVWSLSRNAAEQVLRFHESAVNAAAVLPDGRYVTGGEDGKIAIWSAGEAKPQRTFEGHTAPIVNVAVSPDGSTIASASWDRTVRLWPVSGGEARVLTGHDQNVNGVAFSPD